MLCSKRDHNTYKGTKSYTRIWCVVLGSILFEVTSAFWKMCIISWHLKQLIEQWKVKCKQQWLSTNTQIQIHLVKARFSGKVSRSTSFRIIEVLQWNKVCQKPRERDFSSHPLFSIKGITTNAYSLWSLHKIYSWLIYPWQSFPFSWGQKGHCMAL